MSPEEFKGAKFIRIHEDAYISEGSITDIHFTHREERKAAIEAGAGRKILEAEITTISGQKQYTHDKFAEDLLKFVQARTISN
jgi:hypothetical protein